MPFEGRSNASRMAFFLGGHFVRLPRFSFQQGTTSTLKNLFERHPNPKIPKKYHFKIISPHADLHRPRRFQNLPLQTCGSPYDFQICLCAPHRHIRFQNLSLQTCGVPDFSQMASCGLRRSEKISEAQVEAHDLPTTHAAKLFPLRLSGESCSPYFTITIVAPKPYSRNEASWKMQVL